MIKVLHKHNDGENATEREQHFSSRKEALNTMADIAKDAIVSGKRVLCIPGVSGRLPYLDIGYTEDTYTEII